MSYRICGVFLTALFQLTVLGAARNKSVEYPDTSQTRHLQELEVTARKQPASTQSSAPLRIIDSQQIQTGGITDIGDAMRRMAGVNLRDYGGLGSLKTISMRGLGAQHTGVIYDGAPLSDLQSGQIDISRYSLQNISSISVVSGDKDDIFIPARAGSSASTVAINTMLSPEMQSSLPQVQAKLKLASFSTFSPYIRFSKSNGRNLAFAMSGEFIHSKNDFPFTVFNGVDTHRERRNNMRVNSGNAELNLVWKPASGHTLSLKAYYFDNDRLLPGPVIYYASPSNEHLKEKNAFLQLDYSSRLSSKFSLKTIAKFNWDKTSYTDVNGKYPGGRLDEDYRQNEEYISAVLLFLPIESLKLSYAADYFHNDLYDKNFRDLKPRRDSFLQSLSGNYKFWRIEATARLLMSYVKDKTEEGLNKSVTRFSPSASVSLKVLEDSEWRLRMSYKNIFRMPAFNELYFNHYGTVNLDPEIADQLNVGTTYSISSIGILESMELTADGFMSRIKNKIMAVPYNMFIWTMTNMGKVRTIGFELTLNADFKIASGQNLLVSSQYSNMRAASRTDRSFADWNKQLPYIPLNSGAWSLTWVNPWLNLAVHSTGCSARYSSVTNLPETRMKGYMEYGVTVYRDFKYRRCQFDIRFDVSNIFDKQYEIVRRYPMPGRCFSITIGFNLNR